MKQDQELTAVYCISTKCILMLLLNLSSALVTNQSSHIFAGVMMCTKQYRVCHSSNIS